MENRIREREFNKIRTAYVKDLEISMGFGENGDFCEWQHKDTDIIFRGWDLTLDRYQLVARSTSIKKTGHVKAEFPSTISLHLAIRSMVDALDRINKLLA